MTCRQEDQTADPALSGQPALTTELQPQYLLYTDSKLNLNSTHIFHLELDTTIHYTHFPFHSPRPFSTFDPSQLLWSCVQPQHNIWGPNLVLRNVLLKGKGKRKSHTT